MQPDKAKRAQTVRLETGKVPNILIAIGATIATIALIIEFWWVLVIT